MACPFWCLMLQGVDENKGPKTFVLFIFFFWNTLLMLFFLKWLEEVKETAQRTNRLISGFGPVKS